MTDNIARHNEAQARFAGVPLPADATGAPSEWLDLDGEQWWRTYTGRKAVLDFPRPELPNYDGQVVIEVVGHQYSNGSTVERYVHVNGGGMEELTAGQAREVAAALIAAADELDRCAYMDAKLREQDAADDLWSAVPVDPPF